MQTASPQNPESLVEMVPPKKPRGLWWVMKWVLAILVLMIVLIVLLNLRMGPGNGAPLVRVSPQTTWITSPLKPSGDVDYIAFMNQQYAVPANKNAFVDLVRILGPKFEGAVLPKSFFDQLGIAAVPETGDYLENLTWKKFGVDTPIAVTIHGIRLGSQDVHKVTMTVPFPPEEFPGVDHWFEKNEHHLVAIRSAVRKTGYFTPYGGGDFLSTVRIPHVQQMRAVAWSMQRSSMLRLGRGDVAGAIGDQIAILRFGRLISHMGAPIEFLMGMVLEMMGNQSIAQTIFSGQCTAADLKRLAAELDALPPLRSIDKRYLEAERVLMLDLAMGIGRYGPIPWSVQSNGPAAPGVTGVDKPGIGDRLFRATVDWEVVCEELNTFYDELDKILEQDSIVVQAKLFRDSDLQQHDQGLNAAQSGEFFGLSMNGRRRRGQLVSKMLTSPFQVNRSLNIDYWRKATAQFRVNRVAIALELYRMEHGQYPVDLEELVPQFLEAIPLDPFTERQLVYRPDNGNPFLLYSVGPNEIDDDGAEIPSKSGLSVIGTVKTDMPKVDLPAVPKVRTVQDWIAENKVDSVK